MSKLSYLDNTEENVQGFDKPETTGLKLLTIVGGDDDALDPNHENYIEGAERGGFIIRSSGMAVTLPLRAIPLEFKQLFAEYKPDRGEFIRYLSLEEGKRIAIDPYKFGQKETQDGNTLQEAYNFVIMLPDYENMLCMVSFQSSRIPDGEALYRSVLSQEHEGRKIAPWNQVYNITTKLTGNTKNKWYLIKASFDSFVTENEYNSVKSIRDSFSGQSLLQIADNTTEY